MPKRGKGSKKSMEYCRGYVDEHGQWNNGFYCPQWGGPNRKYCCGLDTHRFCCPKEQPVVRHTPTLLDHLPLILGLAIGCLVVLIALISIICYFCQGCWIYRRRKRLQHGGSTCSNQSTAGGRSPDYAVSYSVCPHPPYIADGLGHGVCYPLDDPPPYPGEPLHSMDEKQPLNPSHLYVAMEAPDDMLQTAGTLRREPTPVGDVPSSTSFINSVDVGGNSTVAAMNGDGDEHGELSCTAATTSEINANVILNHVVSGAGSSSSNNNDINAPGELIEASGSLQNNHSNSANSNHMADQLVIQSMRGAEEACFSSAAAERLLSSSPKRTHQLLLNALSRGATSGSDDGGPAYTKLQQEGADEERLTSSVANNNSDILVTSTKPTSSSSPTSSAFGQGNSIELGAFLRTLSDRGRGVAPSDIMRGRGHDVDDEPQQTTKLLGEGSSAEDGRIETETVDDDVTDAEDDDDEEEDDDDEDDGTSEMTSCPEDNTPSLDDCTVQIIPQG